MFRVFLLLCISTIFFTRCTNDGLKNTVLTESILYVSSETVRMSGRVLETKGTASDHGFEISLSEDFQNPITVSLSQKDDLGLFIGEYSGLLKDEAYYYRAYIVVDGEIALGSVRDFSTLTPDANSFSPMLSESGSEVVVNVENITSNVEVFFGTQKATIVDIRFESSVVVRVPPIGSDFRVPIRVISDDLEFELDTFEYVTGVWRDESLPFPLDDINIFEPVYAQTDDHFVFGLGYDQIGRRHPVLWTLDFNSWSWSGINYPGQANRSPFIEGNVFGGGLQGIVFGSVVPNSELNIVNESGDVDLIGSVPFSIYKGIATRINGELYVYGGQEGPSKLNLTAYKLNGSDWEVIGKHPVVPSEEGEEINTIVNPVNSDIPNFTIDNRSFIILSGKVWEFDFERVTFKYHDDVPISNCIGGAYQVMNNKVYLGLCNGTGDEFYEYDPINKIWKDKNKFIFSRNGYNAGSFQYNGRIYFMISPVSTSRSISGPIDLYSLSPDEF